MSKWDQLMQVKGLLASLIAGITVSLVVGGLILDWRISVKLSEMDLGTDSKIVNMDTSIAYNARTGLENAEDIGQNRRNVEAAFRQLMGMPPAEEEE